MVVPDSVRKQAEPKECREKPAVPRIRREGRARAGRVGRVCLSCDLEGLDFGGG